MRMAVITLSLLLLGPALVGAAAGAGPDAKPVKERYIVAFHGAPGLERGDELHGAPVVDTIGGLHMVIIETGNPNGFQERARGDDRIRYIELDDPNYGHLTFVPNDTFHDHEALWGTKRVGAETAWDTTLGSTAVKVAMVDSGLNKGHEEYAGQSRVLQGFDFINGDTDPEDSNGCSFHGTHTTGTAGATTNNAKGIAGLSQHSILPVKVFAAGFFGCSTSISALVNGLKYAGDQGAHLSSNSWGGGGSSSSINDAITYAHNKGVIHVASAGNGGCSNCVEQPWVENADKVLIVSASTNADALASFSSTGPEVDLIAPGEFIGSSTSGTSDYHIYDGTSMAAPHVTGSAALYLAVNPGAGFSTVESALKSTAEDLGLSSSQQGAGLVRADLAISGSPPPTNDPPTSSFTFTCVDLSCDLDGSGSSDADGSIVSYGWDFGDGSTGTGVAPSHTYAAGGTYLVTLTVTDDDGATGSSSQQVSVSEPATNDPPTSSFTFACVDLSCDFDGSGSSDADGSIVSYSWDFGDGSTGTGVAPSHTYAAGGTYLVTLTVTDDDGATGSSSQQVSVSEPAPPASTLHVHAISFAEGSGKPATKDLIVHVDVYDDGEAPVSGADTCIEVTRSTGGTFNGCASTDSTGRATIVWTNAGRASYTACVTDITHASLTYDPTADHASAGSCASNGDDGGGGGPPPGKGNNK